MKVSMKSLSLAVAALTGFGMASAAFADCPTIPAGTNTPGGGGAWTSQTVTSAGFGSATPGLNSTSCALSVSINSGAASNAKGFVTDTSPQNESRYRARFYIKTSGLTNLTLSNRQFRAFSAAATTLPATAGAGAEMVIASVIGGTTGTPGTQGIRFVVGDTSQAGSYRIVNAAFPSASGTYRVEFDLQQGSAVGASCASVTPTGGCFRYWVSDAASATTDAAPTGTVAVTNSGWSGVKQVNLGLFGTSVNYRANVATQAVVMDEFDSRRQTFIGQ
jgi:hypothetical protein